MTERMGRYELIAPRPGLENTFIARRRGAGAFERYVVVKIIELGDNEGMLRMLADEALWPLGRLHHQHFRNVLDVEEHAGKLLVVTEYVHGRTAREVIDVGAQLPYDFGLTVIAHAAAALHHMHGRVGNDGKPLHMVHRELAPSMLHISYEGAVKVALGIGKLEVKRAGEPTRNVEYLSPEHIAGKPLGVASDVFSLGSILYELTTGQRAFLESSERMTMLRIKSAAYAAPSKVIAGYPPELEAIIVKALQADPAQRFESAEALRSAIAALGHHYELVLGDHAIVEVMSQLFETPREPWLQPAAEPTVEARAYDFDLPSVRPQRNPMRSATELVEELASILEPATGRPRTPAPLEPLEPEAHTEFEDAAPTTLAPPPPALVAATAVEEPASGEDRVRSIQRLFTEGAFDPRETPAIPIETIHDAPTRQVTNRGIVDLGATTGGVQLIPPTTEPPKQTEAKRERSSASRILWIAVGLIVVGGLGIGGYWFATREDTAVAAVADAAVATPVDSATPDSAPDAAAVAPPPPDAAPTSFTLKLTSIPSGASVYIDTKKVGRTPYEGTVDTGKHTLKVRYEGYNTFRHEITGDLEQEVKLVRFKTVEPKPGEPAPE